MWTDARCDEFNWNEFGLVIGNEIRITSITINSTADYIFDYKFDYKFECTYDDKKCNYVISRITMITLIRRLERCKIKETFRKLIIEDWTKDNLYFLKMVKRRRIKMDIAQLDYSSLNHVTCHIGLSLGNIRVREISIWIQYFLLKPWPINSSFGFLNFRDDLV